MRLEIPGVQATGPGPTKLQSAGREIVIDGEAGPLTVALVTGPALLSQYPAPG